jgi:hypothetical protein
VWAAFCAAFLLLRIGDLDAAESELRSRGYPVFPHKNIAVYRTVYWPCVDEGFDFGLFCDSTHSGVASNSISARGRCPAAGDMRITKLTQTLMSLVAALPRGPRGPPPRESCGVCDCRTLARRLGRAIFKLSLGHWRFSVNGPYLSSSENEDGRVMSDWLPLRLRFAQGSVRRDISLSFVALAQ